MKLNGIFGKGSGKVGSSVFAVSGGEQIVRQYNPNVSNPSTEAQVAQRAKFKLMSQIAADLANVIVIPKEGLRSSRNSFVSKNIALTTFFGNRAQVDALALQLTSGSSYLPDPIVNNGNGQIDLELNEKMDDVLDGVVYVVVKTDNTEQMQVVRSVLVTTPGEDGTFGTVVTGLTGNGVVYAYGVKKGGVKENVGYGNYSVADGYDITALLVQDAIKSASSVLTKTSAGEWSLE